MVRSPFVAVLALSACPGICRAAASVDCAAAGPQNTVTVSLAYNYNHTDIPPLVQDNDIKTMTTLSRLTPGPGVMLRDGQARSKRDALEAIWTAAEGKDHVLLNLSGHGVRYVTRNPQTRQPELRFGMLVPNAPKICQLTTPAAVLQVRGSIDRYLERSQLCQDYLITAQDLAGAIHAKDVTIVADLCLSGQLAQDLSALKSGFDVFYASSADEEAGTKIVGISSTKDLDDFNRKWVALFKAYRVPPKIQRIARIVLMDGDSSPAELKEWNAYLDKNKAASDAMGDLYSQFEDLKEQKKAVKAGLLLSRISNTLSDVKDGRSPPMALRDILTESAEKKMIREIAAVNRGALGPVTQCPGMLLANQCGNKLSDRVISPAAVEINKPLPRVPVIDGN